MRISVFSIESVRPETDEQYQEFCDILGLPTLRRGIAEFISEKVDSISKSYLKNQKKMAAKFYDIKAECWRYGVILVNPSDLLKSAHGQKKLFAECISAEDKERISTNN